MQAASSHSTTLPSYGIRPAGEESQSLAKYDFKGDLLLMTDGGFSSSYPDLGSLGFQSALFSAILVR